ncbi:GGDEF domain-containing protein [Thermoproteota archaeon]
MSSSEEFQEVLRLLSELNEKEKALLKDEFHRLHHSVLTGKKVFEVLSFYRQLSELRKRYMDTHSSTEKDRTDNEIDDIIGYINIGIDDMIKILKINFHQLLSEKTVADVQKDIDAHKKNIDKHRLIELHDYQELHSTLSALYKKKQSKGLSDEEEESYLKTTNIMRKIKKAVENEYFITSLQESIFTALERFRKLIQQQSEIVNALLEILKMLKIKKKKDLFAGIRLDTEYSRNLAALRHTSHRFKDNLQEEKTEVYDLLQHFMKKQLSAENVIEYLVENTARQDLLGVSEVSILISMAYSPKELFDLLDTFRRYESLFDGPAKRMIDDEMKRYKDVLLRTTRSARVAFRDALTGLPNDRAFTEEVDKLKKQSGANVSMIAIDIDYFKAFNEVYGHKGGDVVLRRVSQAMANVLKRSTDILRMGGEEFVVLLPDTDLKGATIVAEKIRKTVEQFDIEPLGVINDVHRKHFWQIGQLRIIRAEEIYWYNPKTKVTEIRKRDNSGEIIQEIPSTGPLSSATQGTLEQAWITISVGVASYPEHTKDLDELRNLADEAAVEAKDKGRNTMVIYQEKAA